MPDIRSLDTLSEARCGTLQACTGELQFTEGWVPGSMQRALTCEIRVSA